MRAWLAAGLLGLTLAASGAQARQVGVWGAGAQSCANWTQARTGDPLWKAYFEGWVMGFLSDANVRRYSTRDPNPAVGDLLHGRQPEELFKAVDALCADDPQSLAATAVAKVIDKMATAEDLSTAVRR